MSTDQCWDHLEREARTRLEDAVRRFEAAWMGEEPPRIAEYVDEASTERRLLLLELIQVDLE
ncbi:MAG: hypothetical protein NTY19_01250, partial [Planctomycetota bacterium]|nr:hypothetical protein [Planctomycetota bacterium]